MQRYREHHHGGAAQLAFRTLSLVALGVQMRDYMIESQQEEDSYPEADKGGEKRRSAHLLRLFDRRYQQTPYRGGDHDPGGKSGQRALYCVAESFFHKEYARRSERCAEKRYQNTVKCLHSIPPYLWFIRSIFNFCDLYFDKFK